MPAIAVPRTESLKDTIARALPYYEAEIAPALTRRQARPGRRPTAIRLRGIIKYLSNIGDDEIVGLEIPTGKPIVYELATICRSSGAIIWANALRPPPCAGTSRSSARAIAVSGVSSPSISATPIATLSGSDLPSCRNSQPAIRSTSRAAVSRALSSSAWLEQDRELVAADPRDDVALANAADEQARDLDQRFVAGLMAEAVVDRLQAVEVDEQQRGLLVVAADAVDQPLERAHEAAAVRKVDRLSSCASMSSCSTRSCSCAILPRSASISLDQPLDVRRRRSPGQTLPPSPCSCLHRCHSAIPKP